MARRDEKTAALGAAVDALVSQNPKTTFTELSVVAIAERAGMSRPTFYAYYRDKNALLRELTQDAARALQGTVDERLVGRSRPVLEAAVADLVAAYRPHRVVFNAIAEVASYDAGIRTWYHGGVEATARRLARHIEHTRTRRPLDPEPTARWLVWAAERGLRRVHAPPSAPSPAAVRSLADLLWFTLHAR